MKKTAKKTIQPYRDAERRRVLRAARETGELPYDALDRLLVDSCRTQAKLSGLLRSLRGVRIVDAVDPDDILATWLDVRAPMGSGGDVDHLSLYAEQVRSLPRLTREQEHMLARRLEFARERLRVALKAKHVTEELLETMIDRGGQCEGRGEEVYEFCREYGRLRRHFVERNLYLVIGMASAYRTYGVPMMDLIQEGNAALIRAVEKFDWRKDVRFQTYAAFWIRQAVERLITANRGIVRVPNYIQQKLRRLRREGKLPRNHKDVDVRDVSEFFDTSRAAAARLVETDRSWYSLDVRFGDDDDAYGAMIAADEDEQTLSSLERAQLGKRLDQVMGEALTEQERDIIAMRFGLDGTRPRTLDQIGEQMSVSRERVRQMQVRALDKLGKPRLRDILKDYL